MPPPTVGGGDIMFFGRPSVRCPSVNICVSCHNMSSLSGGISVKLGMYIHHVSGLCKTFSAVPTER